MPSRSATRKLRVVAVVVWLATALGAAWWMSPPEPRAVVQDARRLQRAGRLDEAAAVLRAAPAADLRDPAVLEMLGGIETGRSRGREAEEAFATALRLGPSRIEARLGLAARLLDRGARAEALRLLLASDVPTTVGERHRWMGLVAQAGDPVALADVANRVLQRTPDDTEAVARGLEAAMQRHAWSDAVAFGTRLASMDASRRSQAMHAVAVAQEASGQHAAALATLQALGDDSTWRAQARLAAALERPRALVDLWARHGDVTPTVDERTARAHAWQRLGRVAEADADYRVLLTDGTLGAAARSRYAWWLAERGRHAEAARVASALPLSSSTRELLTFTAAWAGDDVRAARLLPAWLDAHPDDAAAWTLLAEVARRRGDAPTRATALARLVALDGGAGLPAIDLARHFDGAGNAEAAIAVLAREAARAPTPALLEEYAVRLEQQGRPRQALDVVRHPVLQAHASPDLLAREARLWRRAGEPRAALAAWERAVAARPAWQADPEVQAEVVRASAEAGALDAAAQALVVALRGTPDADLLRVGADVETRRGHPGAAVDHLLALGARRALTPDERRWLAGQAEAAHRFDVALAQYDQLLGLTPASGALWVKVAELEAHRGRHGAALDAWRQVPPDARPDDYWRQVTWAAARVGPEAAMKAYDDAWQGGHADGAQCLEAARLHAAARQPTDALVWYERHLASPGTSPAGLELELARAHLGAGQAAEAATWASRARASDAARVDAMYVEAQARHLAGQPREAAAILSRLLRETPAAAPEAGEWLAWLARTAQARGRTLDAFVRFGEALTRGAQPASEFWLARGDLAHARGDMWRARTNYTEAARAGAEEAATRLEGLASERRPLASLPAEVFSDSNDFRHASAGARVALRPSDRGRLSAEWATGRVSQGATTFERTAATVVIDRVFPTERTTVGAQVGIEQARDATQPLWRVDGAWQHTGGQMVQVEAFRESPWRAETWDARMRYNRITDLAAMPGDFHATGARVSAVLPVTDHQELQGNVATRTFSDGNRQAQAYVQYQVPISSRRDTWIALQPYGYVEQWERPDPRYFSPDQQVTAGATLRAIVRRGHWEIDASATPQYLRSESRTGFGYAAVGSVRRDVGRMSVGATGMVFDDRKMAYRVQRVTVDVQVPLGR